jgi:hypothetical protein
VGIGTIHVEDLFKGDLASGLAFLNELLAGIKLDFHLLSFVLFLSLFI